jgi:hypothetical protein
MAEHVKQTLRRHRIACISRHFSRRDSQYTLPPHPQGAYVIGILAPSSIALHKVQLCCYHRSRGPSQLRVFTKRVKESSVSPQLRIKFTTVQLLAHCAPGYHGCTTEWPARTKEGRRSSNIAIIGSQLLPLSNSVKDSWLPIIAIL